MSSTEAVSAALVFVWLGMVLAVSFLEAPLKFRAPGVTLRIGLGIGRIVFRALNLVEGVLAAAIVAATVSERPGDPETATLAAAVLLLVVQVAVVRPPLTRRTDAVLAGKDTGGSRVHLVYVALEVLKVGALVAAGILLLG